MSEQHIITLESCEGVKTVKCLHICLDVNLAVIFHHGEKEGAQADPGAVAVLLCLLAGLSGAGGRPWGAGAWVVTSGLSGDHGGSDVQLEVRSPWRAFAHSGPHQGAGVVAHFGLEPFEGAGHLSPEAFGVGPVPGAELRFAVVLALQLGDASPDARLRILALHRQPDRVGDVLRHPRALHLPVRLLIDQELSSTGRRRLAAAALRPAAGVCPRALTGGCADLIPEEDHQHPGSELSQQIHLSFFNLKSQNREYEVYCLLKSAKSDRNWDPPAAFLGAKLRLRRHEDPCRVFVLKCVSTPTLTGTTHTHKSTGNLRENQLRAHSFGKSLVLCPDLSRSQTGRVKESKCT